MWKAVSDEERKVGCQSTNQERPCESGRMIPLLHSRHLLELGPVPGWRFTPDVADIRRL